MISNVFEQFIAAVPRQVQQLDVHDLVKNLIHLEPLVPSTVRVDAPPPHVVASYAPSLKSRLATGYYCRFGSFRVQSHLHPTSFLTPPPTNRLHLWLVHLDLRHPLIS